MDKGWEIRGRRARAGFSMVELVIVLAIMAVLSTIGIVSMLGAKPHATLESAQLGVSDYLNQARNLAVSEEVQSRVLINTALKTLTTESKDPNGTSWTQAYPPLNLPAGVTMDNVTFSGNTVQFSTRGTLIAGGSLRLVSSNNETSTMSGNLATGRFMLGGGNLR